LVETLPLLDVPIEVLVHAPETEAAAFDAWGRPTPDAWGDRQVEVPDPDTRIQKAANPADQARVVESVMRGVAATIDAADLAIGVPDPEVIPDLTERLEEAGVAVFNPDGAPAYQQGLYQLLAALDALWREDSYEAISRVLRHADVLQALQVSGVETASLLKQLDTVRIDHLTMEWAGLRQFVGTHMPALFEAMAWLEKLRACRKADSLSDLIQQSMALIYEKQDKDPNRAEDRSFFAMAQLINRQVDALEVEDLPLSPVEALSLLLAALARERVRGERGEAQIDLEGWLELPWNDARYLVVTGMNEGSVPAASDTGGFLSDTELKQLGLRSDADRLARDAYLMTTLVQCRAAQGAVTFVLGATNQRGDPLQPSRLLFRRPEAELPALAKRLFKLPEPSIHAVTPSAGFMLNPWSLAQPTLEKLSISALNDYLACPFRYYLKRVLKMRAVDDTAEELDAMGFGNLVHDTLEKMATPVKGMDVDDLMKAVEQGVDDYMGRHYPQPLSLPLMVQRQSAINRLRGWAVWQVEMLDEGWEIVDRECVLVADVNGVPVEGHIDVISKHPELGWRILDFKTSQRGKDPKEVHWRTIKREDGEWSEVEGQKNKEWINLQLPLYRYLVEQAYPEAQPVEIGYFNLPAASSEAKWVAWELDAAAYRSAITCAEEAVERIRDAQFWPPAMVKYDDFESVFPQPTTLHVEAQP
jgi:ATP-dependent helicase/nuclease subunit B